MLPAIALAIQLVCSDTQLITVFPVVKYGAMQACTVSQIE